MKKFCSDCGQPLEISKKFCSDCGTRNPYFSINHDAVLITVNPVEELKARKETIERELEELAREEAEVRDRENLQKEMEELHKQRVARLNRQKEIKERFEREEIEAGFKKEISEVRQETELYKQHTHNLLVELRDVIVQIDDENKRLKEEVQQIAKVQPVTEEPVKEEGVIATPVAEPMVEEPVVYEPAVQQEAILPVPVIEVSAPEVLVAEEPVVEPEVVQEEVTPEPVFVYEAPAVEVEEATVQVPVTEEPVATYFAPAVEPEVFEPYQVTIAEIDDSHPLADAEVKSKGISKAVPVAIAIFGLISMGLGVYLYNSGGKAATVTTVAATEQAAPAGNSATPANTEIVEPAAASVVPAASALGGTGTERTPNGKPQSMVALTVWRAKTDLVGQNLTGCGIKLGSAAEVTRMSVPQLVERSQQMGYVKYKLDMYVKQAGTTFHVTPYMYYNLAGKFTRVDAANCE